MAFAILAAGTASVVRMGPNGQRVAPAIPAHDLASAQAGYGAIGEAVRPGGDGYWVANQDGIVENVSPAPALGDLSGASLSRPIEAIVPTGDGAGYWMVASDGGIFTFGDASFYGSTGNIRLNQPIVGMAPTPDGHGYWLVARDGGIFSFGDASFYGSTGKIRLSAPVVGMAASADGDGYWLVARDGGIFSFGDAGFYGSTGNIRLSAPVVGMAASADGHGYWLVASDGGIFSFGDASFQGSGAGVLPAEGQRAVGMAGAGQGGYWIESSSGTPLAMHAPLSASGAGSTSPGGTGPLPAGQDPGSSIAPATSFASACFASPPDLTGCDQAAVSAIDQARAGEGYGPLPLPSGYGTLSFQAQLVATANAERTTRGLPSLPESASVDSMAQSGAQQWTDPTGPSGYGWASNWAENYPTALAADFVWMYDDGPDSPNLDCTSSNQSGCWGHRKNILSPWGGRAGAGVSYSNGNVSTTQLFVENYP